VNEDITNLVFGVLLIAIMIFWQDRSQGVLQLVRGWRSKDGHDDTGPPGDEERGP
jgi:hypothetical protein